MAELEKKWQLINLRTGSISNIISIIGVISALIGAAIAYISYKSQSEDNERAESLLEMKIDTENTPVSLKRSLLFVQIELSNKGKRSIRPYAHTDDIKGEPGYTGEGLTISITKHAIPDSDSPIKENASNDVRVVPRFNILEEKYSYQKTRKWDEIYVIKPNTSFREVEAFSLERNALYEIRARFYAFRRDDSGMPQTWTTTETKYIFIN